MDGSVRASLHACMRAWILKWKWPLADWHHCCFKDAVVCVSLRPHLHPAAYWRGEMCIKAKTIICAYSSHVEWMTCGHYFRILSGMFGCQLCPGLCSQPSRQWRVSSVCETPSTCLTRFFFFPFTDLLRLLLTPPDSMTHLNLVIALHLKTEAEQGH